MPMSQPFKDRLYPILPEVTAQFGTPFHIYDEVGIRQTGNRLKAAFSKVRSFREYYAVKALPNPHVLSVIHDMGFGFDCSSIAELVLSREVGASGNDITFTSNNTSQSDFEAALSDGGCILNLDDISLLDKLPRVPERICFRYNPGAQRTGNAIIGNPIEAKYGISHDQFIEAYRRAQALGIKRFGLHTMLVSNERNYQYMVDTVKMLLGLLEAAQQAIGIAFEFINIGGGLGIPYRPDDEALDVEALGSTITELLEKFAAKKGYQPA
ncbi:MAG: diaminopimelate decarboxylase, partial [Chloroflexota bacterium]